jgi:hypothetical protein
MPVSCPQCNTEDTQRLSLAYESGISDVNTTSSGTGIGFGSGGIGIGIGSSQTHGIAQTVLSQRAAPPFKASYLLILKRWFIALILATVFMLIINASGMLERVISLAIHATAVFALFRATAFNHNQWPVLFQKWQQSYICLRCGNIFEIR